MTTMKIECPQCKHTIEIDKVLELEVLARNRKAIEEESDRAKGLLKKEWEEFSKLKAEQEEKMQKARSDYAAVRKGDKAETRKEVEAELKAKVATQMEHLQKQVEEKDQKLREAEKSELDLLDKKKELEEAQRTLELNFKKKVESEMHQLKQKIKEEAEQEIIIVREEAKRKAQAIKQYQESELGLRKEMSDLKTKLEGSEIEVARQLNEERQKIRGEALKQAEESHLLQLSDKEKSIQDLKKMIDDLKSKTLESSQQQKGEVAELEVEGRIRNLFPTDLVEPVAKGTNGVDILLTVNNNFGQPCGTMAIEIKRAKAWSNEWIRKLKDNQQTAKAEIAILITNVMPASKSHYFLEDGIWIADYQGYQTLIAVLRMHLIELSRASKIKDNHSGKMKDLYMYISGTEFKQRVSRTLETMQSMRDDLGKEKDTMAKMWARREKYLESALGSVTVLSGEIEAILCISADIAISDDEEKLPLKTA